MDPRDFLIFSLCFLFLLSNLSHSAARVSGGKESLMKLTTGTSSVPLDPTRVTQISWRPRAFIYRGFLTDEECDHLITLAKDKLEKSMVVDNDSGKSIESEVRTSSGMFLKKAQSFPGTFGDLDLIRALLEMLVYGCINLFLPVNYVEGDALMRMDEIVESIEARIAAWTFLPPENGESIQILHYEHGQKYEPHFDYFHDKANQELGGHRLATVLIYLSNIEKGGETVFPISKATQHKGSDWSDCAKIGNAVKPQKGDALLFFSLHPNATTDALSLHRSCPVIEGEKWSATKWIHVRSFDKPQENSASGDCVDSNPNCPAWALLGECEKNSLYMVGSEDSIGYCRKSCKVCSS